VIGWQLKDVPFYSSSFLWRQTGDGFIDGCTLVMDLETFKSNFRFVPSKEGK